MCRVKDGRGRMASDNGIEASAADWLACLDRPEAPAADHEAFEAWCRADPQHLATYLRLLAVWNRLDALKEAESAAGDAVAGVAGVPDAYLHRADRWLPRTRTFLAIALAAGLAAIVAAGLAWWQWAAPFRLANSVQRYATTLGEFRQITLADGSVVQINTDSALTVRLRGSERDLTLLHGEATFAVAPDKSRPFIVMVGRTGVRT